MTNSVLLNTSELPYWRLSSVYFFNCLILGLVLPYWGLYLDSIGHTSSEIGISSGLLLASTIVAPFFWERLNNSVENSITVIRMGILLAFVCSLILFELDGFIATSLFIFGISFCWQGINPLMESLTLAHLGSLSHHYGHIRLWGSIGFTLSVAGLGLIFEFISISHFPLILSCFIFLMLISIQVLPGRAHIGRQHHSIGFFSTIKHSGSVGLFVAIFFAQISQGAYIGFFSLYLKEHGIGMAVTGNLWAVAVIAEVLMFLFVHRLIAKLQAGKLLLISLLITAIRWLAIALFVELLPVLFIAQLCHAFTYSATHSAVLELIRQQFTDKTQAKGIVIYCSLCLGGGTAIGAVLSGYSWQQGSSKSFVFSAIIASFAVLIASYWLKKRKVLEHKLLTV